jgi:DNA-binding NtrC family response regulator
MRPRLTIQVGDGQPAVHILQPDKVVSVGRNRNNAVVLQDKHASRWHAEITLESGQWMVRDCDTMNGTKLNGQPLRRPMPLVDGDEIRIGETSLCFNLDPSDVDTATRPSLVAVPVTAPATPPANDLSHTSLQSDELSVLCGFMAGSLGEISPRALVARALAVVHGQTRASVTGFLSLDEEEPLPKVVLPELTHVDFHLSRYLTQQVQRGLRPIWLGSQAGAPAENESLLSFKDAVCVPLLAGEAPLGALHVYKAGGSNFSERDVRFCELLGGFLANSLHALRSRRQLEAENQRLRSYRPEATEELVGTSAAMAKVRQQIARLAPRPATVLVGGESGVGKELVALALHRLSPRADGPLVTINCAAIPAPTLESELFGHVKGAFTGADRDRKGFFQQADEGTLFLDEIGELPAGCQAKLLRVLEGKGFQQVGGETEIKTDVRIIAATNRDLEAEVQANRFRRDLFFRLGIPIRVPPLRDHPEDLPELVDHFLKQLASPYHRKVRLSEEALVRLRDYSWPGNVRQLRSVLEHAVAMGEGSVINVHDLHLAGEASTPMEGAPPSLHLEDLEKWAISQALRRTRSNLSQAAKVLGIHRDTLSLKMKKYEIEKERG